MQFTDRLQHAWNAFVSNKDPTISGPEISFYNRPDRARFTRGNERSIIAAVYSRIANDVATLGFQHVKLDENGRYSETIDSGLNNCLTLEANMDQTSRSFIQDIVISCLDEGVIAVCPIDTEGDPFISGSYDIRTMRVGKIVAWSPDKVQVNLYDQRTGNHKELWFPKKVVAIIENPFYSVMNEPNSTLQRLIRKLNLLDMMDERNNSSRLDLIIQLPYTTRTTSRQEQAERRRSEIEQQLTGSRYGIAYTDGTEHITQLNRSVDNQLMSQVEYLTSMLYSQLGISQGILDGTADEKAMLNYNNRTIEPLASAIVDEMKRKFLTKTARSQKQSIEFFKDPFKLVQVDALAELSDKLTRNEIMTSNEIRQIIGMKPSKDPNADMLRNKNLSQPSEEMVPHEELDERSFENEEENQNAFS